MSLVIELTKELIEAHLAKLLSFAVLRQRVEVGVEGMSKRPNFFDRECRRLVGISA